MLVRRIATVTISAPLASTASFVCARSLYLPVPISSRERNSRAPILRVSFISGSHGRLDLDLEVDGVGHEAVRVCLRVQFARLVELRGVGDADLRGQRDLDHPH